MDQLQTGIPQSPETVTPTGTSQEQMRGNLQGLMSRIEGKYQDYNSQKFASDNKVKEQQGESLRQIFDLFQSVGVDPSNVEEVGAFLSQLKETNPELAQQLEKVLNSLIGDEGGAPVGDLGSAPIGGAGIPPVSGVENPPVEKMNINEIPQENL